MFWRLFFVTLLLALLGPMTGQESAEDGCASLKICEECTNLTNCYWMTCKDNEPQCFNSTSGDASANCTNTTCAVATVAPTVISTTINSTINSTTNGTVAPNGTRLIHTLLRNTLELRKNDMKERPMPATLSNNEHFVIYMSKLS
ncbi:sialomucin core protein 24-like [Xyrauchen texanus]|uniref:sialomucin core protein 24-like n=1 Tax=Xyrauchen texanus TaxID=154827 RepID=UPI0022421733|nr:sialomucin core protein 24-like [Xyrauchen texanus]